MVIVCWRAGMSRKAGVPNSVSASRKDISAPARMAGRASGRVIRRVVLSQPEPSSAAERSSSDGISSRALETKVNAYG